MLRIIRDARASNCVLGKWVVLTRILEYVVIKESIPKTGKRGDGSEYPVDDTILEERWFRCVLTECDSYY